MTPRRARDRASACARDAPASTRRCDRAQDCARVSERADVPPPEIAASATSPRQMVLAQRADPRRLLHHRRRQPCASHRLARDRSDSGAASAARITNATDTSAEQRAHDQAARAVEPARAAPRGSRLPSRSPHHWSSVATASPRAPPTSQRSAKKTTAGRAPRQCCPDPLRDPHRGPQAAEHARERRKPARSCHAGNRGWRRRARRTRTTTSSQVRPTGQVQFRLVLL